MMLKIVTNNQFLLTKFLIEDAAPGKVVEGHFYDHWTEFFEAVCPLIVFP